MILCYNRPKLRHGAIAIGHYIPCLPQSAVSNFVDTLFKRPVLEFTSLDDPIASR